MHNPAIPNIVIVGATGSGKSTLALQIGRRLQLKVVDLDALHFAPGWILVAEQEFRKRVTEALAEPGWITAGNYSKVREITWGGGQLLIWLDYPLPLVFWRLLRRTVLRIVTQEEVCGGNHETFHDQFLSRESLFLWLWKTHPLHRREIPRLLELPEYRHLALRRFRSPHATRRFLEGLPAGLAEPDAQPVE